MSQAAKKYCARGHEYSEPNTKIRVMANGRPSRVCKACERTRWGKKVA